MKRLWFWGALTLLGIIFAPAAFAQEDQQPVTLTRESAVALALKNNPALREDYGRIGAAVAATELARSAERLQFNISPSLSFVSQVPTVPTALAGPPLVLSNNTELNVAFAAKQVIYSGGRLQAQVRQADDSAQAVVVNSERTRELVAYQAESAYYQLYAALRDREVAQQSLDTAEAHLKVAQARLEARAAPQFDVIHARVQVQEARQSVVQADSDIETTHATLLQALGLSTGSFTTSNADLDIPTDTPAPVDTFLKQAMARRPELQAINWQLRAADAAVLVAQAGHKPTVALSAGYQLYTPTSITQFNEWMLTAAANFPILDGGATNAAVREALAQRVQIIAQRDSVRNTVAKDVHQAYAQVISASAQVSVARQRVQEAEELLRVANVRYAGGVSTPTEVADAQTTLTQSRQGLTSALALWGIASAQLRLATGASIPTKTSATEEALR